MRVMKLTITVMLAVCVVFPAAAASKKWEECHAEALRHGLIHGHKGNDEFIKACMAGNIRQSTPPPKRAAAAKPWEQCHAEALRHGLIHGHKGNDEFMKACMAGSTSQ
jgi:predicted secreted Zn-dependent protease